MDRKVKSLLKGAGLQQLIGGDDFVPKGMTPEQWKQQQIYNEQRAKEFEERKKNPTPSASQSKLINSYQDWVLSHDKDWLISHNLLLDTTGDPEYHDWLLTHPKEWLVAHKKVDLSLRGENDPVGALYILEQRAKGASPEAIKSQAAADTEKNKAELEKFKSFKPNISELHAFRPAGLTPTSTIEDFLKIYEDLASKNALTHEQKLYSNRATAYKYFKDTVAQTEEETLAKKKSEIERGQQSYNKIYGIAEGMTTEEAAKQLASKNLEFMKESDRRREKERIVNEWRAYAREEEQKYREEAKEAMTQIINKAHEIRDGGGDLIDVEPLLVMADKLKFGLTSMGQVFRIQEQALKRGMDFKDYVEGVNNGTVTNQETGEPLEKIVLWDANASAEEESQKRMAAIPTSERIAHFAMNLIYKGLDFATEKVAQLVPVGGKILQLGWKAFAPYGSANFEAGTFGERALRFGKDVAGEAASLVGQQAQKYAGELAGQAGTAVKQMLGFGKTRAARRRAMERMIANEGKFKY